MSKPNQKVYNLVLDKVTQENGGLDDVFEVIFSIELQKRNYSLLISF